MMGVVVPMRRISRSDPTPERLLRAEGYWEEGDAREVKVLTMMDHPLGRLYLNGAIARPLYEAGDKYHHHWYHAGLAGTVPAINHDSPMRAIGGDNFGGMPRSEFERTHRLEYRAAVQHVGMVRSRIVELVTCSGLPLEFAELGWPQARKDLLVGLEKLSVFWGL